MTVRDEYDKLVIDYIQLQSKWNDELLVLKNWDNTPKTENQEVIRYLQGQVADLTAENDTLHWLQE